ncbi:DNA-3-methyladenine glycosylase, partial [Bacillus cereus]|uniref:8-oxoguanine DNA glycosylase, N-terminal domain-containing protein n=1 Tax=Bacillus cereus TaxID=1396 RepID=UPI000C017977
VQDVNPLVEISVNTDGNIQIRCLEESYTSEESIHEAIANYVNEWFDLTTDLGPFYTLAKHDVLLQRPIEQYNGLRTLGIP